MCPRKFVLVFSDHILNLYIKAKTSLITPIQLCTFTIYFTFRIILNYTEFITFYCQESSLPSNNVMNVQVIGLMHQ